MSKSKQRDEISQFLNRTKMIKAPTKASEKSFHSFQDGLRESKTRFMRPYLPRKIGVFIAATITVGIVGLIFLSSELFETENLVQGGNIKNSHQDSGEVQQNESQFEEQNLGEPYDNIIRIIKEYKFPTDGVVSEDRNMVSYENGYSLFKGGMGYSITYEPEIGPAEPTKEQYLPIIVGIIHSTHNKEAHDWEDFNAINQYIEDTVKQLNQAKAYSGEYQSLLEWLDETIGYLEEAKNLVPNDEAKEVFRRALTNIDNFMEAKEIAEK